MPDEDRNAAHAEPVPQGGLDAWPPQRPQAVPGEGALAAIGEDGLAAPEWDDPEGAEEDGELAARRIGEITDAAARLVPIDQDGAPADPDEMLFAGIDDAIRVADELAAGGDGWEDLAAERQPVYRPDVDLGQPLIAGPQPEGGTPAPAAAPARRNEPNWRPLYDLPGYVGAGAGDRGGQAIRALGRTIFRPMPCYRHMEEQCRAAGRDPLGEVQVLADIAGRGPNPAAEMEAMVAWIRQHGRVVDAGQIDFAAIMPGYRPNVILAVSENDSFLLVEDTRENGAPVNATYIYSWAGGRRAYEIQDGARPLEMVGAALNRPALPALPAPRAAQDARRQPQPARGAAPDPFGREGVPGAAAGGGGAGMHQADARAAGQAGRTAAAGDVPEAAPPAPAPAARPANAMQVLRGAGFATVGTDRGPALTKEIGDGRTAVVMGDGRSLVLARTFAVAIHDPSGDVMDTAVVEGADAVLAWIGERPASGMRM